MTVDEFVCAEASRPFAWGETDCASTADRWMHSAIGFSPLAAYGRKYTSEAEARAWLAEPGGLAVAVNRVMRAAGLKRTGDPQPGDVGLVFVDRQTIAVAISSGPTWFTRSEAGAFSRPLAHFLKAWRVE